MIDLHAHTTASDGSCTPTELVLLAREMGLTALGIADHDTVAGLKEAEEAEEAEEATATATQIGLELVPAIEISVDYAHGEFHLLGYYVDFRDPAFVSRIQYLQDNRVNRNELMVRKMREMGFDLILRDIAAESGGGQIGRPHMARALLKKGYVSSIQEAFHRYLGDGKPLHVPKIKLSPMEAIELVHSAGGVAVLAHPKYMTFSTEEGLLQELGRLRAVGLDGLECYYSQHTEEETARYLRLAQRFGFLVTAGSDFHGVSKPDVPLGVVYQGRGGEEALLEKLKQAARRSSGFSGSDRVRTPCMPGAVPFGAQSAKSVDQSPSD